MKTGSFITTWPKPSYNVVKVHVPDLRACPDQQWLSPKEAEEMATALLGNVYDLFYFTDKRAILEILNDQGLLSDEQFSVLKAMEGNESE